jgi:hypothetical protein
MHRAQTPGVRMSGPFEGDSMVVEDRDDLQDLEPNTCGLTSRTLELARLVSSSAMDCAHFVCAWHTIRGRGMPVKVEDALQGRRVRILRRVQSGVPAVRL